MPIVSAGFASAFTGGTIEKPLVIDVSGDATGNSLPLQIRGSYNNQNVDFLSVLNTDTGLDVIAVDSGASLTAYHRVTGNALGSLRSLLSTGPAFAALTGLDTAAITSGALPTLVLTSGAASQISATGRDVFLVVPVTFNPTAGAAATCKVEVSPDNATYSILGTETVPAGVALDGTVRLISLFVPGAWYVKLTVTNATIGTATYY